MYLTKEKYFEKRGIDLEIEFLNSATDNPSKVVEIFLQNIEEDVILYMQNHFYVDTNNLDKEVMEQALIHQVDYIRRNGDLSLDSDNTKGYELAPKCYQVLKANGYANCQTGKDGFYYGNKY